MTSAVRARTSVILVCGAVLSTAVYGSAEAQCTLRAKPGPEPTGYKSRGYGCEGFYTQLQSARLNVQVISLVKYRLDLPKDDSIKSVKVSVPEHLAGRNLRDSVVVTGRGREANLNWALDWYAKSDSAMTWMLDPVIHKADLESRVGVYGETVETGGAGRSVYVPLQVGSGTRNGTQPPNSIELIVRVPAAARLQYWGVTDSAWKEAEPDGGNGDGYFRLVLEPRETGRSQLEIRWRPTGEASFSASEALDILFW